MAKTRMRYGKLAAGLAAASVLGACSGAGFKGASGGSSSRLAERSADAGDYQTSETLYRQAFEANPNSVEALVGLGRSYAGMGQYARAEQALNEASRRKPNDPQVLLELARTEISAGQPQAALANIDSALKRRPNDVQLLTARGIALDRLSRHAEAQATYRKGLQRDPTDFALLSNLGLSLGLSGQTSEGITILRELVRDGSATANTRGNLALVYGLAGREREASAALSDDMSPAAIQNNLAYYRQLRAALMKGKPIKLDQPAGTTAFRRDNSGDAGAGPGRPDADCIDEARERDRTGGAQDGPGRLRCAKDAAERGRADGRTQHRPDTVRAGEDHAACGC